MLECQKKAKLNYQKKLKRYTFEFYPTEQDLIDHIEKQPQKQTYIKNLVRVDMKKDRP